MLSANQIEVVKEQAYAGFPSQLSNICQVKPGMMSDLLKMGSNVYNARLGLLLLTETEIAKLIKEKTNENIPTEKIHVLEYLLKSAEVSDTFLLELQSAFATFITEEVLLLPKINSVLVGPMSEKRLITENNFNDFQTILRIQNRKDIPEPPPENESAGARKMRLLREQREAVKRKQMEKESSGQSLADLLEIAGTFGIDYKDKSIYAFYGLIKRHQLKEKWNQDLQMICAGADSKKIKPKYWGENPDKE